MEAEGFAPCRAPAMQTKVFEYRLWDVNQKSLYLRDDQLVAGHLQGANAALEEKVFWVPNRALGPARLPVILSVRRGASCLRTERGRAGPPRLRLQDVDIRSLSQAGDSAVAFTFFRSYAAGLWRFESAAHPGWFLCTSPRGHQPLALCRHRHVTSPGVTARGVTVPGVSSRDGTSHDVPHPGVTSREVASPGVTAPDVTSTDVTSPDVTSYLLDFYFQLC